MVKFKALHRLFGKIRTRNITEERDNSVSRGGQSPRGSTGQKRSSASPTNGSRNNHNGRKVKVLMVISSLFKTSKGKPMSNDDGKDDECLCTSSSPAPLELVVTTQEQSTEEVNKVVTQTLDWELASSLSSLTSISSLTNVTELSDYHSLEQSLTKDNFDSDNGEIKLAAAAAGDLKQITRKGNDVAKDDDVIFWKRYMLAVSIVFVLLLLI